MILLALSQLALADTITLDSGVAIEGDLARYEFGGDCQISVTEGELQGVIVIVPCRRVSSFVRTEIREPEVIGMVSPPVAPAPSPVVVAVAQTPPVAPIAAPPPAVAAPEPPAPPAIAAALPALPAAEAPEVAAPPLPAALVSPPAVPEAELVADAPYANEPVAVEVPVGPASPPAVAPLPPPPAAVAIAPTPEERLGLSPEEPLIPREDWTAPAMGSIDPEEESDDPTPSAPASSSRPVSF